MKTAMQELIEYIELNIDDNDFIKHEVLEQADKLLEKEKEQIINFAYEILETSDEHQSGYVNIEEIYNQTYNQNK